MPNQILVLVYDELLALEPKDLGEATIKSSINDEQISVEISDKNDKLWLTAIVSAGPYEGDIVTDVKDKIFTIRFPENPVSLKKHEIIARIIKRLTQLFNQLVPEDDDLSFYQRSSMPRLQPRLVAFQSQIQSIRDLIENMPKSDQKLWTQIADKAIPTLMNWHWHYNQDSDRHSIITTRELFLGYLKTSIEDRVLESFRAAIENGVPASARAPVDLPNQVVEFLLNLADMMTIENITIVSNDVPWAASFFRETSPALKMKRDHAQDFIQRTEKGWQFVDKKFIEILNSINIVELTYIESRLHTVGISARDAHSKGIEEFATSLFTKPEGPFCYRNRGWGAAAAAVESKSNVLERLEETLKKYPEKRKVSAIDIDRPASPLIGLSLGQRSSASVLADKPTAKKATLGS